MIFFIKSIRLWRGGSPVGIGVEGCLEYLGVETDHISIRTSYTGMSTYADMILYKYTSLDAARQILASAQIGFSRPGFFNDPFDKPVATPEPSKDPITGVFAHVRAEAKSIIWEENTAILSLTRSPTNPLRWAHYSDGHRGAVLEINAHDAGFTNVESNMIPAQFGSVIYSRNRPTGPYYSTFNEGVEVGGTHHFVSSHYEKWQRLFLTKPLEWAYEEEVRVAKCLKGPDSHGSSSNESGNCNVIEFDYRLLYCFEFPRHAITKAFVGVRADKSVVTELSNDYPEILVCPVKLEDARFEIHYSTDTRKRGRFQLHTTQYELLCCCGRRRILIANDDFLRPGAGTFRLGTA